MDVKNCKECGRLFNYLQGPQICPVCKGKLEDKFDVVKNYIRENEGATLNTIAEVNEVSVKQLKQWVREERLIFAKDSPVGIDCEVCGTMIRTGRFCDKCKNNMASNLKQMYETPFKEEAPVKRERDGNKMRFLDTNK